MSSKKTSSVRMPAEIDARLKKLAEAVSRHNNGMPVTYSDAQRLAIEAGLPQLEAQYGVIP